MFRIRIYQDAQGNQPIKDYLATLEKKTDKNSRIQLNKIDYYFQALKQYGTQAGEPFVKHIENVIWELRPLRDRFFFFYWQDNVFVLLHHFTKKTKKTPKKSLNKLNAIINLLWRG